MSDSASNSVYALAQASVDGIYDQADAAVAALVKAANDTGGWAYINESNGNWQNVQPVDFSFTTDDFSEYTLATLADLDLGSGYPTITLPTFTFNPEDYITADLLKKYTYDSTFFDDTLDPKLVALIESDSLFTSQTIQDALFQQTRERDLQILNDSLDANLRVQARTGFPLITDMILSAQSEIIKKYEDIRADRNKEITALIAEKVQQSLQHSIESGIKMEDIRSRFSLEYARLYWQAADYLLKKYEADIKAEIARYEGQLRLIQEKTSVSLKNLELSESRENALLQKDLLRLQEWTKTKLNNSQVWIEKYQGEIDAAKAKVDYLKHAAASAHSMLSDISVIDKTA